MKKRFLSAVLVISTIICLFSEIGVGVSADVTSGSCGQNVTWEYNTSTDTLTISGSGYMSSYDLTDDNQGLQITTAPWRRYYNTMQTVVINSGVNSIGPYAFVGCSGITSVTIPNSVRSIGLVAFYRCTGIESIAIPNGVQAINEGTFDRCTGLTNIIIPSSVSYIDSTAFRNCSNVTSISVASDNNAFHSNGNCLVNTKYKSLILGCKTSIIPIDGSVTSISYNAFSGCTGLTSIEIPDSVTTICDEAFYNCINLSSITIPDSVTEIGAWAFNGCSSLQNVYYAGSEQQKTQISIDNNNNGNQYLLNATWHYNCTPEHAKVLQKIDSMGETLRSVYMRTAIQTKAGASVSDENYDLRLISMIDCLDYSEIGFYITIAGYNGGSAIRYSTDTAYTSFMNGSQRIKASDYGAEYFSLVTMTVPNEYYSSNMTIQPYIIFNDGTEFSGNAINTTVSNYIK